MSRKAWVLVPFAVAGWAAVVACGAGSNGVSGTSTLVSTTAEPAGANCASGGTRIDIGPDSNGNGTLDPAEITQTRYVCNGAGGAGGDGGSATSATQFLIAVTAEAAGANCAEGGQKIQSGPDTHGNGTLDASEVKSTEYVCNGDSTVSNGSNPAVVAYDAAALVTSSAVTVTAQQASITVPGPGSIVAIGSVDAFCALPALSAGYDCVNSGTTSGYVTLDTVLDPDAAAANYDFFFLTPNNTESLSRTAVFPAASAGTYTVYLRGEAQTGQIGFFRGEITLLFVPH